MAVVVVTADEPIILSATLVVDPEAPVEEETDGSASPERG